jgi:prevent-host-death family protein
MVMMIIWEAQQMTTWQVHSAKARFSELLERAEHEGPQVIAKRGAERAVVLSIGEYRRLVKARPNLRDYLLGGPKVDEFEVERPKDYGRGTEL